MWKKNERVAARRMALRKLSRGRVPECAGCPPGTCGAKSGLQIDHIHDDGHLDLSPTGQRMAGDALVRKVLDDPDPWAWAQVLCGSCNVRKAVEAKRRAAAV